MFNINTLPQELLKPACEIAVEIGLVIDENGTPVTTEHGDMKIESKNGKVVITYRTKPQFFRLFAMLKEYDGKKYTETPGQTMLCYMADQSRNAVMTFSAAKKQIRLMAAMGYDSLMLYTEDTYEIPEQPYFGHMRGRWTQDELCRLVEYGEMFGVELIPCIQALAHLQRIFRWKCYKEVHDCDDILLAGSEKTYALIEDMFRSCRKCFKSNRINLGLDEAHMLGRGKYLDTNGYRSRSEIILEHLSRVCEIAGKYGFKPMIWSDMFFRIAFGTYYVKSGEISQEVIDKVPKDLTLIYWDYYSDDEQMVDHMIKCHLKFNNPVAYAGGLHKWGVFVPSNVITENVEKMHIRKCAENGLTQIIMTGWGDDGADAAAFSVLPSMIAVADMCYKGGYDQAWIDSRVESLLQIPYEPFKLMDDFDTPTGMKKVTDGRRTCFQKKLLYSDVLVGLLNRHINRDGFYEFYKAKAKALTPFADNKNYGYIVRTAIAVAELNALKSTLPIDIRAAYERSDKAELMRLAKTDLPAAIDAADRLLRAIEEQWRTESRAFGLEVQQLRIGGLKQRLSGIIDAVNLYCTGKIDAVDELEQPVLYVDCRTDGDTELSINRGGAFSASWKDIASVNIL